MSHAWEGADIGMELITAFCEIKTVPKNDAVCRSCDRTIRVEDPEQDHRRRGPDQRVAQQLPGPVFEVDAWRRGWVSHGWMDGSHHRIGTSIQSQHSHSTVTAQSQQSVTRHQSAYCSIGLDVDG